MRVTTILFLLILLTWLVLDACQTKGSPISREDLIKIEIDNQEKRLIAEKNEQCKQKALDRAVILVDSIIAAEFTLPMIDTIAFPMIPDRPRRPYDRIELDTSYIGPLLQDTTQ